MISLSLGDKLESIAEVVFRHTRRAAQGMQLKRSWRVSGQFMSIHSSVYTITLVLEDIRDSMFLASHHFLNSVSDLYSFQSLISKSEHTETPLH